MKTIVTSNSRLLRRALCALSIGIAALWVMPTSVRAQLYVSSQALTVGKYDATAGAAINANFFTGLTEPVGLAASVHEPPTWGMIALGAVASLGMIMLRKKRRAP